MKNVLLAVETKGEEVLVNGNWALLQQALLNLLTNARDAVKDLETPKVTVKGYPLRPNDEMVTTSGVERPQRLRI